MQRLSSSGRRCWVLLGSKMLDGCTFCRAGWPPASSAAEGQHLPMQQGTGCNVTLSVDCAWLRFRWYFIVSNFNPFLIVLYSTPLVDCCVATHNLVWRIRYSCGRISQIVLSTLYCNTPPAAEIIPLSSPHLMPHSRVRKKCQKLLEL